MFSAPGLFAAEHNHDTPADAKRLVVLDPGHGGHDQGARGPSGSLEKDVALRLAFAIAKTLMPSYRVVITRTGDYRMDLVRRTSVADHQGADVFIGLHTGANLLHHANAWEIYYFKPPPSMTEDKVNPQPGLDDKTGYCQQWDDIQIRHTAAGKRLAGCLKARLSDNHQISNIKVGGASLRVLEGADMPAVLLEAGYLTNPETERLLNDAGFLAETAEDIRKGIDDFFGVKN